MSVDFKDYYAMLGVAPSASDADIKKAFRAQARKYHPDVARNQPTAEGKFKEINEANEVLSDPDKRRKYDALGADWKQTGRPSTWRAGGYRPGAEPEPEFHFDGTGFSDFFEEVFGHRGRTSAGYGEGWTQNGSARTAVQPGRDIEGDLLVTLNEVRSGATRTIHLRRTDPRTGQSRSQTLRVIVPPGVREGQLIRLAGKGQDGLAGGRAGHLYLRVAFAQHPEFRVRGAHLYHDLELTPWEAVLGATVPIPTLDGMVSLKIPPGTTAERVFRLRGKGLPTGSGARGDLYAEVRIQVPSEQTPEQKQLWEQLAAKMIFNPRATR